MHLRRHQKEKAEIEYAKARADLMRAEEKLRSLGRAEEKARTLFRDELFGRTTGLNVKNHALYVSALETQKDQQRQTLEGLRTILRKKKKELLEKEKQEKVLETLREKDFEKWRKTQNELEQKRINELAVLRHGRTYV
ncbi:MAG: flagellar export protein FliJ [Deltaproteobacteria bacterium]